MIFWFIILIGICIGCFVFPIVDSSKKSAIRKRHKEVNQLGMKQIEESGFYWDKIYYLGDYSSWESSKNEKQIIVLDTKNEKIALFNYETGSVCIFDFNEIIGYELYENGSHITEGAKVGGILGFFASETTGNCKELRLIIRTNSFKKSQFIYEIIGDTLFGAGVVKTGGLYKNCILSLQEAISMLEVIKDKNKKQS